LTVGSTFTQDDIDNVRLTYTHSGRELFGDFFSYTVKGTSGVATSAYGFSLTIDAVNDAPRFDVVNALQVDEGGRSSSPTATYAPSTATITPRHGAALRSGHGSGSRLSEFEQLYPGRYRRGLTIPIATTARRRPPMFLRSASATRRAGAYPPRWPLPSARSTTPRSSGRWGRSFRGAAGGL